MKVREYLPVIASVIVFTATIIMGLMSTLVTKYPAGSESSFMSVVGIITMALVASIVSYILVRRILKPKKNNNVA